MKAPNMIRCGEDMISLAQKLFPICRSITGDGVRLSLGILNEICPIKVSEIPSGTQVFDWVVPKEWNIRDAYIEDSKGNKVADFKQNNLHVMGYSIPVNRWVSKEELTQYLYTEANQPDAIPYVTSYYKERFGFCITENQKHNLPDGQYHIVIDSELKDGSLTYGEILLPGESDQEIFLSTYICHPSMANDNISGPCVAIFLARLLREYVRRRYTYRIIFIPETIGSIAYLSNHCELLKTKVIAGFNISCVGDNRCFSHVESRYGNTLADKVARNILAFHCPDYKKYTYLKRGSDERQYCAPGIDLPVCAICRSKYGEFPEYHTSKDDLAFISAEGLAGSLEVYWKCIMALENNYYYKTTQFCEPQLGKRGLYPTLSRKGNNTDVKSMMNFIAYADGKNDLIDISNIIHVPVEMLILIAKRLEEAGVIGRVDI